MKINSVLIDDLHPFFRAAPVQCGHIDRSIITNISGIIRNTTISIIGHFHISSPPRQPFCILVQFLLKFSQFFRKSSHPESSWSNVFCLNKKDNFHTRTKSVTYIFVWKGLLEENLRCHDESLIDFGLQTLNHSCLAEIWRHQKILWWKISFSCILYLNTGGSPKRPSVFLGRRQDLWICNSVFHPRKKCK